MFQRALSPLPGSGGKVKSFMLTPSDEWGNIYRFYVWDFDANNPQIYTKTKDNGNTNNDYFTLTMPYNIVLTFKKDGYYDGVAKSAGDTVTLYNDGVAASQHYISFSI